MFHVIHSFTAQDLMRLSRIVNSSICCKYILFQFTPKDVTDAGMNINFISKFKVTDEIFYLYRKDECSAAKKTQTPDVLFKDVTWLFDITMPMLLNECSKVVTEFDSSSISESTRQKTKRKISSDDMPMDDAKRKRITEGSAAQIQTNKDSGKGRPSSEDKKREKNHGLVLAPFQLSIVVNKEQYKVDVKYIDLSDVQQILRDGFGEKSKRALKLKTNNIRDHWENHKFIYPFLEDKEGCKIFIVPDRFFEIEVPMILCRKDSAPTYLSQSELNQTDSDVFLSLINSRQNAETLGSIEERQKGIMVTRLLNCFSSHTKDGLVILMVRWLRYLPRLFQIHYVFEDMIVHINYSKGKAKLMYFNNEGNEQTLKDEALIEEVLIECKGLLIEHVKEDVLKQKEKVRTAVGLSELEHRKILDFDEAENFRSYHGSLMNTRFQIEKVECKPCENDSLKRPLVLLALHHSIFLDSEDFATFLVGEKSKDYLKMFVTKVKQMSLQYVSLILENERVKETHQEWMKLALNPPSPLDDEREHVYLKSDACNETLCKDLPWLPNQLISLQLNKHKFEADLGDGYSESDLLSISLFALYVNNDIKKPTVLPFIGGTGLMEALGKVREDLSKPKGKGKNKRTAIQLNELNFFKENKNWTWDDTKSFGFICPNQNMDHLVSVILTVEEAKCNKKDAEEIIQKYNIRSRIYDSHMTNPEHAIEEVPKDHKNDYKVVPNRTFYQRALKSSVLKSLKRRSRKIKEDQFTSTDPTSLHPSTVYGWDDSDHSCGVSAVIHQASQMFRTKELDEEVGGISKRFETVAEYKKTMYALFVCAAYHFLIGNEFKGFNYLELNSFQHTDKLVKDIDSLSSQKKLLEDVLKNTENLGTKVGKHLLSLFHFLGEIIANDQITTVNENSNKEKSVKDSIVTGKKMKTKLNGKCKYDDKKKKVSGTTAHAVDRSDSNTRSNGGGTIEPKDSKDSLEKNRKGPSEYKTKGNDDASISSNSVPYHLGNNFKFK